MSGTSKALKSKLFKITFNKNTFYKNMSGNLFSLCAELPVMDIITETTPDSFTL